MIDSSCYSKSDLRCNRLSICVWVDDIIYLSTSSDLAESFKKCFSEKFKIEDKASMKWFLGVLFEQSPGKTLFSKKSYVLHLLSCFGMSDCNLCDLPMTANTRINKSSCLDLESDTFRDLYKIRSLYRSLVGKLNYVSVVSRPDLSFVVSYVSQVLKNFSHDHWLLAKKVLRCFKGTFDLGLVFERSECLKLVGFCDSDLRGDCNDRRSTSGYCFKISDQSSVICWSSSKQQTVALSSAEAEHMSISLASQECVYLLSLVKTKDRHTLEKLRSRRPIFPPRWQPRGDQACSKPNHKQSKQTHRHQTSLCTGSCGARSYSVTIYTNGSEHCKYFE